MKKNHRGQKKHPVLPKIVVTIDSLNTDGIGVGRHENKEILVANTLPGEEVSAFIEHEGQRRFVGRLSKVIKKSPQRVFPGCQLAAECSGCSLIHQGYPFQLEFKTEMIRDALSHYATLNQVKIHDIWAAKDTFGYRTNAKLAVAKVRGKAQIGLYKRASHEVLDIGNCPQQHPLINRIIAALREEIEKQDIYVYNPVTRRGLLRYVAIRVSPQSNKALVTLVCTERNYREMTHLAKWLKKKAPEIVGIHQNINASAGNVVFGTTTAKIIGGSDLIDQIGDIRLRLSPTSFFQVNHTQAARIYALVQQWAALTSQDKALDLYCGVGGIAMHLATSGAHVLGIEINEEAIFNAKAAAQLNELPNCRFIAADATQAVQDLHQELQQLKVAVVNPPRSGCSEEVIATLGQLQPETLIYVSCNPYTLGRDLHLLTQQGFQVEELQPVDMFPQTPHVESVVRLTRATGNSSVTQ
ncbi:MAG: 23S rRNA (uracil(1939)-C(5))-methyltransferase RlmD [Desulfuromonas sp.]|nr:MAG: 23S rRNA (uracil(1939)-C(5))-methyltransferase RlmD [Desulfuromonas sp.]